MLKKRLVGVVTIKDGWAVQSFRYQRYLPLGKPECIVENLDRWGADEILVQAIDRSRQGIGPDFEMLERLGALGLETPLIYGGGIGTVDDAVRAIQSGADRLVVDALLRDDVSVVSGIAQRLGAQAVVASLPLAYTDGTVQWLDYRSGKIAPIPPAVLDLVSSGVVSEVLVTDYANEGLAQGFDGRLARNFPIPDAQLILFGGISEPAQMRELLAVPNVVAVCVGNFLSYQEHAVQRFKEAMVGTSLRPPSYESRFSLIADV